MKKMAIGLILALSLCAPLTVGAESPDSLTFTTTTGADGDYELVVELRSPWRFNDEAPREERLRLSLDGEGNRFDGNDFVIDERRASLTFQATAAAQADLTALVCRESQCRRVTRTVSWDAAEEERESEPEMVMPEIGGNATASDSQDQGSQDRDADEADEAETSDREALVVPDVVVSGTRAWQESDDAPVNSQVVDRDNLEERNARNVAEALEYTTGVRVENNCQNCGFTQLRLNGLGGAYSQILVDGLPSFSGLASVYGLEQIPSEILERVVIVKGGGSALYGPSAVAGVVDLVTRQPTENFLGATTSYEHVGLRAPDARLSLDGALVSDNGNAAGHFFATTRGRNALDLSGDGFSELTALRQLAAGTNLFFTPFEDGNLRLSFHTVREYRRGGDQLDLPPHAAQIAEELQTERYQGDLRWRHRLSPHLAYALGYVVSYTDRRSYYGGGGGQGPTLPEPDEEIDDDFREAFEDQRVALGGYGRTLNPLHIGDAHADLSFDALGPQVVTVGVQATVDQVEDKFLGYDRVIDETYTSMGAYAQHHWIFADWGESILGARLDKHSALDVPVASPRAALMLHPLEWLRLRTAFSTGFRAPQVFNEDLHVDTVGGNPRLIVNAPDLQAERSLSVSQQVAANFTLASGADLRFSVNGFHTRLRDAFVLQSFDDTDSAEEVLQRTNRGTTSVLGSELEAGFYTPSWALRTGWTLERAANEQPDEDFGERRILRTPDQYGYLEGLLNIGSLRLVSGLEITGPMLVPRYDAAGEPAELHRSPWFFNWSANVSFATITQDQLMLEPFLGVRNLLDSRQRDFDLGPERDAAFIYGPAQPRTIYAGVRGRL